jgi:methylenetetrahydrofolate reductase (NADPH)
MSDGAVNEPESAVAGTASGGLRSLLTEASTFVRIAELVPLRGPLSKEEADCIVAYAHELAQSGAAHAFSITDNAGGAPKISPESLGSKLREQGHEVIVHLSCKDLNRSGLESRAWALASSGFRNLLCITGDYPVPAYRGRAEPVFDLDSVALLELLHRMNSGLEQPVVRKSDPRTLPPTDFFLGAGVSPFKLQERELMPQYFKLQAKVDAGAQFIITQTGYDSRKFDELIEFMRLRQLSVPAVANIFVLTGAVARYFHRGNVAGVVVTDDLLALAEKQAASPDKGKKFFHEFAAKQIAVARRSGYRGAYLSGHLKPEEFEAIFALADSYGESDCRAFGREIQFPQPGEFYLFEQDPETGLSAGEISHAYQASLEAVGRQISRSRAPLIYRISRTFHCHLFDRGSTGFRLARGFYGKLDGHRRIGRWLHVMEQAIKIPMYGCQDCGDCSLPDVAYLCPMSACIKNQRNGPCGGSHQGVCESAERDCIWARAYDRLKCYGEESQALERPPILRDDSLRGTSSWANTFLDRDHAPTGHGALAHCLTAFPRRLYNPESRNSMPPHQRSPILRRAAIACKAIEGELRLVLPADVELRALEQGLHRTPPKLRESLQQEIDSIDADEILMGYGLCGNGIVGLRSNRARLVVPAVDDCISMLLGSFQRYKEEFLKEPGTYWLSQGWIEHSEDPYKEYLRCLDKYGEETALWVAGEMMKGYTRLALIDTGTCPISDLRDYARTFASFFNLEYMEMKGSDSLFRSLISRELNGHHFVVVEPGQEITQEMFGTPLERSSL